MPPSERNKSTGEQAAADVDDDIVERTPSHPVTTTLMILTTVALGLCIGIAGTEVGWYVNQKTRAPSPDGLGLGSEHPRKPVVSVLRDMEGGARQVDVFYYEELQDGEKPVVEEHTAPAKEKPAEAAPAEAPAEPKPE